MGQPQDIDAGSNPLQHRATALALRTLFQQNPGPRYIGIRSFCSLPTAAQVRPISIPCNDTGYGNVPCIGAKQTAFPFHQVGHSLGAFPKGEEVITLGPHARKASRLTLFLFVF